MERTARVRRSMRGALAQKSDPPQEQRWPAARQPDPDRTSHRALGSFPDRRFSHARALRIACSGPPAPRRLAGQRDGCLGMKQAGDRPVKAAHCSKSPVHALACILARLLPLATDLLTEPIEPTLGLSRVGDYSAEQELRPESLGATRSRPWPPPWPCTGRQEYATACCMSRTPATGCHGQAFSGATAKWARQWERVKIQKGKDQDP